MTLYTHNIVYMVRIKINVKHIEPLHKIDFVKVFNLEAMSWSVNKMNLCSPVVTLGNFLKIRNICINKQNIYKSTKLLTYTFNAY